MLPTETCSPKEIQQYTQQIVAHFHPDRIILFGSHAGGYPNESSDVDLLVVMDFEGSAQEQAFRIRRTLPRSFSLDLLVRRPAEIERRIRMGDFFLNRAGWHRAFSRLENPGSRARSR